MGLILVVAGAAYLVVRAYRAVRASAAFDHIIDESRRTAGVIYKMAELALGILDVLTLGKIRRAESGQAGTASKIHGGSVRFGDPAYSVTVLEA